MLDNSSCQHLQADPSLLISMATLPDDKSMMAQRQEMFTEVCSQDFLSFSFGGRGYQDQLNDSIAKTSVLAAVKVERLKIPLANSNFVQEVVWVTHNFSFLGGSLGCAEGEKLTRAFELAAREDLPVCVQCRSGGARMQEGTSSLMQMAKVSVAVQALGEKGLPFIAVLCDPTFGGVSASYAMQADVRIGLCEAKTHKGAETAAAEEPRIGFAGPTVILNTMCEGSQARFDEQCPADFQRASLVQDCGQVDLVLDATSSTTSTNNADTGGAGSTSTSTGDDSQTVVEQHVAMIASILMANSNPNIQVNSTTGTTGTTTTTTTSSRALIQQRLESHNSSSSESIEEEKAGAGAGGAGAEGAEEEEFNYTRSRRIDRPQCQDILRALLSQFTELTGDGKVGRDRCLRGGIGFFHGVACVGLGTFKGHSPTEMEMANYGMPSPHGYRTALRLMQLAEKFRMPVLTLVDTVGAWPTFECELTGQSEAIATNLTLMAGLKVPIVTLVVGEGGSGGALGICMGNRIGMLSGAYFGVISPEGAASILGRYRDEAHKSEQFPKDCQALAEAQSIYAHQLRDLGVVDEIIWESSQNDDKLAGGASAGTSTSVETYQHFPQLQAKIEKFLRQSLLSLVRLSDEELVAQRYGKYRQLGTFAELDDGQRIEAISTAKAQSSKRKRNAPPPRTAAAGPALLLRHLAQEIVQGARSKYRKLAPVGIASSPPLPPSLSASASASATAAVAADTSAAAATSTCANMNSAKYILDTKGAAYLCQEWLPAQASQRVLVTDTTMRDAHQSLLATRVRTEDLVKGARVASTLLADAFSVECWGGATFDVCMRFLDECPWERLRKLRQACPNICLQMLIRGANAVGYTSYPDNVVEEFVRLAAKNGMDVFRIFDCFNQLDSMLVSINAVLASGKVAEVCVCYTGNMLTSSIYTAAYYASLARDIKAAGAHILGIKDMAGLLRPQEVAPLMTALREAVGHSLPIHFHTHATSSGSLATCMEMAKCGCNIIDFATASMADGTSQPSLNAFVAMTEGNASTRDTGIDFMSLEPHDTYWREVRAMYAPFESGMKSGTARVFDHQIPGGQYSNLLVQCAAMGLQQGEQWNAVMDAYRDVNKLFGDVVKVTPSSKCVGDLALYLVLRGLTTKDLIDPATGQPTAVALQLDFPESVVGLLKGDLGFPHRGFPTAVAQMVLKAGSNGSNGVESLQRKVRAGLTLPPADLVQNISDMSAMYGQQLSEEQAMSCLLYPKVFSDYQGRLQEKGGPLWCRLPTPVFWYGAVAGDRFSMTLTRPELKHLLTQAAPGEDGELLPTETQQQQVDANANDANGTVCGSFFDVLVEVKRIGPLQSSQRTIHYHIQVTRAAAGAGAEVLHEESQEVVVRDTGGVFVFEGPMADPSKPTEQLASPMGGIVEKLEVVPGQTVQSGQVLCVISAMKMEVNVSAPCDAVIGSVAIPSVGYRVVEGALLFTLK